MTIALSDQKVGTCSVLIIINIININIIVNILSVLEFVQECALEFALEFVLVFVLEFVLEFVMEIPGRVFLFAFSFIKIVLP